MAPERDLYERLGVPRTATPDEIKTAYRRLARKHHPDVNPGDKSAEERFKEVAAAFDVLGNPEKRKLYDEMGPDAAKIGYDPEKAKAWRQWQQRRTQTAQEVPFDAGEMPFDIGDLFGDLFGGAARRRRPAGPMPGEDLHASLDIDLAEAVRGSERRIGVVRDGKEVRLDIRIPRGATEGTVVRLAGQGGTAARGGPPGDLLIEIHLRPHAFLRRDGQDLLFDLPVTVGEAVAGAEVTCPTFEGPVHLKIPPGSQTGRKLRLRGKGLPDLRGGRGDLYAVVAVAVPPPGDEANELARKLDRHYTGDVRRGLSL